MNTEEVNLDDIDQCSPEQAVTGPRVYAPTYTTSSRRGIQSQDTLECDEEELATKPSVPVHDSGVGTAQAATNNATTAAPLKTTPPKKGLESSDSMDVADF